ncbi:MAG: hypothetical protein PWQ10_58 [Patescibacteria group bacterium]|nr:hypothetical protein [Patescibacteria group bacterium]
MSTEIELEKTYLAKSLPIGIKEARSVLIHDVYIPESVAHAHLRLRQKDDSYVITKKYPVVGNDSSKQYEYTIELEKDEFMALAKCSNKDFTKRRYFMDLDGFPAEIDVYQDKLLGLVVIDFEFNNEADKDTFITPDFVLADVTQDEAIAGGFLAGKSIDDIMPLLVKYGYEKMEINL